MNFLKYSVICLPKEGWLFQYATCSTATWLISMPKEIRGKIFKLHYDKLGLKVAKFSFECQGRYSSSLFGKWVKTCSRAIHGFQTRSHKSSAQKRKPIYNVSLIILIAQIFICTALTAQYRRTGFPTFWDFRYFPPVVKFMPFKGETKFSVL